jgi:hypothetical protein
VRLWGFVLLAAAALPAHADGKIFSTVVAEVPTPDQRAILHFEDGRERLVIETSFHGEGEDFAWVVPLPSVPKVEPVSPGVFRTLETLIRPRVIHRVPEYYVFFALLILFVGLIVVVDRFVKMTGLRLVCLILITLLAFGVLAMFLAPMGASLGIQIHQTGEAGSYEFAAVSSSQPGDVLKWLEESGFKVAPESTSVVRDYVSEGWVFVAGRLKAAGPRRPHPLSFEFETKRAVYPLRLTGVGQGPLLLDLHVFADQRASSDRLETVHCAEVSRDPEERFGRLSGDSGKSLPLHHAGLTKVAGDARTVTKLSGTLEPADMREDLTLDWEPYAAHRTTLYTARAARISAANGAAMILLVAFVFFLFRQKDPVRYWTAVAVVAALFGLAIYALLDVAEGRTLDGFGPRAQFSLHERLAERFESEKSLAAARALAKASWKEYRNQFTGGPVLEEDSPGNYLVREREGKVEYVWFGASGKEHRSGSTGRER